MVIRRPGGKCELVGSANCLINLMLMKIISASKL